MEADQIPVVTHSADGGGLEDQPGSPVGIKGGGDDAGFCGHRPQFLGNHGLAQHQTVDVHFQRSADHIRLVAADDDGVYTIHVCEEKKAVENEDYKVLMIK